MEVDKIEKNIPISIKENLLEEIQSLDWINILKLSKNNATVVIERVQHHSTGVCNNKYVVRLFNDKHMLEEVQLDHQFKPGVQSVHNKT